MDKKNLRKKDLIASLILLAVGIFVLVDSFRMIFFVDLPGVEEVGWFVAPGIFPFMLSVGIIVMSLIMLSIAYRESGRIKFESWRKFRKYFFYAFVLLKKVHFTLATFIYLFLSMFVVKAASWYKIAMISVLAAVVIAYLFGNLFKIPLP
jgi:hypothetical protein